MEHHPRTSPHRALRIDGKGYALEGLSPVTVDLDETLEALGLLFSEGLLVRSVRARSNEANYFSFEVSISTKAPWS